MIARCGLPQCEKELTEDMKDIEYSANLGEVFCCPDHAMDYYFDYMMSTPLDNTIDDREEFYFKDGKLHIDRGI